MIRIRRKAPVPESKKPPYFDPDSPVHIRMQRRQDQVFRETWIAIEALPLWSEERFQAHAAALPLMVRTMEIDAEAEVEGLQLTGDIQELHSLSAFIQGIREDAAWMDAHADEAFDSLRDCMEADRRRGFLTRWFHRTFYRD